MISKSIKNIIEQKLNDTVESSQSISGGCISNSSVIKMKSGEKFFLKENQHLPKDMFEKEASGLREIQKSKSIRVPYVKFVTGRFILLEYIEGKQKADNFFEDFGAMFAELHRFSSDKNGFYEDNFIGSTPQLNIPGEVEKHNWTSFYFNKRLLFQFKLAESNGYADETLRRSFLQLENKMEQILGSTKEKQSLLHGDLWGGNYIVAENGKACLIDPAVYYGNREADLAMTKLFGGFTNSFYKSYNESFPLEPGCEYRENIYKLYHVLNHLNLFGSAYYSQALSMIRFYL
jgi:fructosamine-3-kinase